MLAIDNGGGRVELNQDRWYSVMNGQRWRCNRNLQTSKALLKAKRSSLAYSRAPI